MDGWAVTDYMSGALAVRIAKPAPGFFAEADLMPPAEDCGMVACSESAELYLLVAGEVLVCGIDCVVVFVRVDMRVVWSVDRTTIIVTMNRCFGGAIERCNGSMVHLSSACSLFVRFLIPPNVTVAWAPKDREVLLLGVCIPDGVDDAVLRLVLQPSSLGDVGDPLPGGEAVRDE